MREKYCNNCERVIDNLTVALKKLNDLEACCEKLAGALEGAVRFGRELCEDVNVSTHQYSLERGAEALAEYRAMRDETKMPCPKNK